MNCLAERQIAHNDAGWRVGETHHNAVLTDRDVTLLQHMRDQGMTYGRLAQVWEISKSHAWRVCNGGARSQLVAVYRIEPIKLVRVE